MPRFIHTADWQMGKPYRQIVDEQKRFKLQQERLNVISLIRGAARMQAADFAVVAGDLFDSPTPPTTFHDFFYRRLAQIALWSG